MTTESYKVTFVEAISFQTLNHSPTDLFSRMHCPIDCAANVFYSRTALFLIHRCIAKCAIFPLSKSQVSPHFSLSCLLFTCFLASLHVCCLPTVAMYFNAKMFKVRCQLKLLVQSQTLLSSNCLSVNQLSVYNSFFFYQFLTVSVSFDVQLKLNVCLLAETFELSNVIYVCKRVIRMFTVSVKATDICVSTQLLAETLFLNVGQ